MHDLCRRLKRKLASAAGETLVETLAAILVAALSVTLLVGGVNAAAQIDRAAQTADDDFYADLTAAEGQVEASAAITVTVTAQSESFTAEIDANLYGREGDLRAYARQEREGGTAP